MNNIITFLQNEYVALKWTLRPRKLNSAVGENEHFRRKKWTVAENDCERQLFHDKIVLHVYTAHRTASARTWNRILTVTKPHSCRNIDRTYPNPV